MDLIPSFAVDHTNLHPGIYISRKDNVGGEAVTTYDIRMTSPNQEPALAPAAIHTIEHLVATYLRNDPEWKDNIIYWGPMGCLTGNYLIMKGEYEPEAIRQLMIKAFQFAKWEAKRYVERLKNNFCCTYPGIERPKVQGSMDFFDA